MSGSGGLDDPYLPTAFAIQSTPGAFAVLAGAGISRGAGVPTAWEVVTGLVEKVRMARGGSGAPLDVDSVEQWWAAEFGTALTYSAVLDELSGTPAEREALLRGFFEPDDDGPVTSAAHRAVARLVKQKTVRVIVTMNFDHLFETALNEVGIVPTVVRTTTDAESLRPLHTIDCLVVHLHGDYRDAASMKNTVDELSDYGDGMKSLLDRILGDHALLVVGWSVAHDVALRAEVAKQTSRHHTSAWIDPYPSDAARDLAMLLGARVLEADADDALGRIADVVETLTACAARHPVAVPVAVDRIKKDLTAQRPAITAHDTFMTEYELAMTTLNSFRGAEPSSVDEAVDAIANGSEVLCAAAATLAYWGTDEHDHWWRGVVADHAMRWRGSGSLSWLSLPLVLATRAFYAAGVAATAGRRYESLTDLFNVEVRWTNAAASDVSVSSLHWGFTVADGASRLPGRTRLAETLAQSLQLPSRRIDEAWEEFEVLRALHQICTRENVQANLTRVRNAEAMKDPTPLQPLSVVQEIDRAKMALGSVASLDECHVFVREVWEEVWDEASDRDRYVAPAVGRVKQSAAALLIYRWLPDEADTDDFTAVVEALETSISAAVHRGSGMFGRVEAWLDGTPVD